jgi:hypothetical protein
LLTLLKHVTDHGDQLALLQTNFAVAIVCMEAWAGQPDLPIIGGPEVALPGDLPFEV